MGERVGVRDGRRDIHSFDQYQYDPIAIQMGMEALKDETGAVPAESQAQYELLQEAYRQNYAMEMMTGDLCIDAAACRRHLCTLSNADWRL